ncbi:YdcH family protein [Pseudomonas massiliensis]|uniref:YdcH family protein n=1 Tax=Pseudomonas massiliensis TaxID=522492 RepID=UPI0005916A29|nr:YdcH family protein [Pseudomonas massiliensis]
MPVTHNLYADLGKSKEEVAKLLQTDSRLQSLINQYEDIDRQVVDAENASADDDTVSRLKEKRLSLKDKIVQQIDYPGTQGAAKNF